MALHVAGTVLATILFEHTNSVCDKEGLLLGKLSKITKDTISDSSLNNVEHQTVYCMHSFVPCEKLFSWYNSKGEVEADALNKLLSDYTPENVIGWYKLRRNSTLSPSLRERAINKHLEDWMNKHHQRDGRLIFFLCVSQSTCNGALYTTDHHFMIKEGSRFQNLPVTIMNLGNISKPDYQSSSNFSCSADSTYSAVVKSLSSTFLKGHGELESVKKLEKLKTGLHKKLKIICDKLIQSEAELAKELDEVRRLQLQLQSAEGSIASEKGELHGNTARQVLEEEEEEEEEKELMTFDDDDDDDDGEDNCNNSAISVKNVIQSSNKKNRNEQSMSGETSTISNIKIDNAPRHLLDEPAEAFDDVCLIGDNSEERDEDLPGFKRQQYHGVKNKRPGQKPQDLVGPNPKSSLHFLRNQSAADYPSVWKNQPASYNLEPEAKDTMGRNVTRSRGMRENTDCNVMTSSEEALAHKSKRSNVDKVYERCIE